MSTPTCSPNKVVVLLFASLAVNIFMLGFVAAKLPFGHHGPRGGFEDGRGPREFGRGPGDRGPSDRGPGAPPPPYMSARLFSKDELAADKPFIESHFAKVRELRKVFAEQLKAGPLTAAQIQEHFTKTDAVMEELKQHFQEKMVGKLTSMTPEERTKFAERSLRAEERIERRAHGDRDGPRRGGHDRDRDRGEAPDGAPDRDGPDQDKPKAGE